MLRKYQKSNKKMNINNSLTYLAHLEDTKNYYYE